MASHTKTSFAGPFTVRCPTCPPIPTELTGIRFTAHLPTSAPLSGPGHHGSVSGQLPSNGHLEEQPHRCGFLSAFAHRHSLLGHPVPARRIPPPLRLAYQPPRGKLDSVGVSVSRTCEIRPGWMPSLLRGGGVVPAAVTSMTGTCRFSTASPIPRWSIPSAGAGITKHTKIHSRSPVRPSPCPPSPDGTKRLRLLPWASHPTVTHDARQGGDGPVDTGPGHTISN